MVYVYVLRSLEQGTRYVGITSELGPRLRTHARGSSKGGQQLGRFELIHREEFPDYQAARVREKFLKSGMGRAWLDSIFGPKSRPRVSSAAAPWGSAGSSLAQSSWPLASLGPGGRRLARLWRVRTRQRRASPVAPTNFGEPCIETVARRVNDLLSRELR